MNTELETQALTLLKVVALRFFKGAVAGALTGIAGAIIIVPHTLHELLTASIVLTFAAFSGFLTGGLLAIEKYLNFTDTPPTT